MQEKCHRYIQVSLGNRASLFIFKTIAFWVMEELPFDIQSSPTKLKMSFQ